MDVCDRDADVFVVDGASCVTVVFVYVGAGVDSRGNSCLCRGRWGTSLCYMILEQSREWCGLQSYRLCWQLRFVLET